MKLLLICQWAVTSHDMVTKITNLAKEDYPDLDVTCCAVEKVKEVNWGEYDAVLLAPQVRNYMKEVGKHCEEVGTPYAAIDISAYGLGDAKKILAQALKLMT